MNKLYTLKPALFFTSMIEYRVAVLLIILINFLPCALFAQTPTISYSGGSKSYQTGIPITALVPTSINVSAFGHAAASTKIFDPIAYTLGPLTIDPAGNLYTIMMNKLIKIPPGGGSSTEFHPDNYNSRALTTDVAGNIYILESSDPGSIYKITPAGVKTTVGTGFYYPYSIVVDHLGNIYIAESGEDNIKKIAAKDGSVSIVTSAVLNLGRLAMDPSGNLYATSTRASDIIYKIPLTGTYPVPLSDLVIVSQGFRSISGLAADNLGNLYVSQYNNIIYKVVNGVQTNIGAVSKPALGGIAIGPSGNVYVTTQNPAVGLAEIKQNGGYYISPALPAGLVFDGSTGTVSGTPTEVRAAADYTITAYNSTGTSSTAILNISVAAPPLQASNLSFSNKTATSATVNWTNGNGTSRVVFMAKNVNGAPVPFDGTTYTANPVFGSGDQLSSSGWYCVYNGTGTSVNVSALSEGNVYNVRVFEYTSTGNIQYNIAPSIGNPGYLSIIQQQLPAISYSGPQTYLRGVPITALTPVNSGGSVPPGAYGTVNTVAGASGPGLVRDLMGNLYIGEQRNKTIEKIAVADGTVSTIASGFGSPEGLAIDPLGNLYLADKSNNTIQKIAQDGTVSTFATGFNSPFGIAFDAQGNMYVTERSGGTVKKIPASGGPAVTIASGFIEPFGITLDAAGNIYVADRAGSVVKKIAASNGMVSVLGSGFSQPFGVVSDTQGNIYVTDQGSKMVKKIAVSDGTVTTIASGFDFPCSIIMDAQGNLYVAAPGLWGKKILKVTLMGYTISPALPAGLVFNNETGVISGTPTAVSTAIDYTVTAYNSAGSSSTVLRLNVVSAPLVQAKSIIFSNKTPVKTTISWTNGDGSSRAVFIAKNTMGNPLPIDNSTYTASSVYGLGTQLGGNWYCVYNGTGSSVNITGLSAPNVYQVMVFEYDGVAGSEKYLRKDVTGNPAAVAILPEPPAISYSTQVYSPGQAITPVLPANTGGRVPATVYGSVSTLLTGYSSPNGLAIDVKGNIYMSDGVNGKVYRIPAGGNVPANFGSGFNAPAGIALDASGNAFVADAYLKRVYRVSASDGTISEIGGSFNGPRGVALDAAGNLYVTDFGPNNNTVYKITATGAVYTIGSGFFRPLGLAVDTVGNVYVSDNGNNAIKKISASDGMVTTVAAVNAPAGLAIDAIGNIYVGAMGEDLVKRISAKDGTVTTIGSGFNKPSSLAVDVAGNVYEMDNRNPRLNKISATGYTISPALPDGLSFDAATGQISGTPTTLSAAADYTVTAYNEGGSSTTKVNIKIALPALIQVSGTITALNTIYGTASGNTSFTIKGSDLSGGINIKAPTGFEVSVSAATGFSNRITLPESNGKVDSTTIYLRLSASAEVATYNGNVIFSSLGATDLTKAVLPSTVDPRVLTLTATGVDKIYNKDATATVTLTDDRINNDDLTVGYSATFDNQNAGLNKTITLSNLSITGPKAGNYKLNGTTLTTTANITTIKVTVTADAQTKVYGASDPALTYTFDVSPLTGDSFSGSLNRVLGEDVGTYAINQNTLTLGNNYSITYAGANLVIGKGTATIVLSGLNQTYDGTAKAAIATTNPAGLSGISITYDGLTTAPTNSGTYAVVASLSNSNYTATNATGNLVIGKGNATLTLSGLNQIYDGTAKAVTVLTNPAGLSGVSVTYDGSTTIPTDGGTYAVVASLTNSNYTATNVTGNLVIGKGTATITLSNLNQTYDGTAKAAVATTNPVGLSGISITYDGLATVPTAAGTYVVVASLSNSNYTATNATGNLVIGKGTATITLSNLNQTYDGTAKAAVATTNPVGLSGISITYDGLSTVPMAAGTYVVVASLSNSNYTATNATGNLVIGKGTATIVLTNLNQTYDGTAKAATAITTPAGLSGISITYDGLATMPTAAGTYTVVASLTNSNYTAANATGNLVIGKRTATIILSDLNQTYDGTAKAVTATTNPAGLSGISITYDGLTTAPTAVGTYAVVASLSNANYTATNATGNLVIGKGTATIILSGLNQTYDGTAKSVTAATNPAGLSGISITYDGLSTAPTAVGTYAVVASLSNANYTATNATGSLTIGKGTAIITLDGLNQTYDGTAKIVMATTTPAGLSGISITYDGLTTAPTAVGTYAVVASLSNANYTATNATGSLTIGKGTATITLSNLNHTYDGTAKSATAATNPAGLSGISITYDGLSTVPTAVGTYSVVASLSNANYVATNATGSLTIGKGMAIITLNGLNQTYDGTAKIVMATTTPVGLSGISITYDGLTTAPTAVGTYAVVASLSNANYTATTATGNLVIGKGTAIITLSDLNQTYDGTAKSVTAATNPAGLSGISITYDGLSTAPTAVGTYAVVASLSNANYTATNATGSLTIGKGTAIITLDGLNQTYDGTAKIVMATTTPAGLSGINITYDGLTTAPTAAGTYAVVASLSNANYTATNATGSLTIGKGTATITLSNLNHTYDGTVKSATAATNPAGLSGISITYDGSTTLPINAGTYAVVASLSNANYVATNATGSLTIGKGTATITLSNLNQIYDGMAKAVTATTNPTGLSGISITYDGLTTAPKDAGTYAILASLNNTNYTAANVTGMLEIGKRQVTITADAKLKNYGETDPVLTYQVTSGTLASPDGFTGKLDRDPGEGIGTYAIHQGTLALGSNYTLAYVGATLTITNNKITFAALAAKTYGDADFNPGASSTNTADAIVYTSDNPNVATIVNGKIHLVSAGTANITASQRGAVSVDRPLMVAKAGLTVRANDQIRAYGTANPVLSIAYSGFVNGEDAANLVTAATATTTATASSLPGSYPITVSGAASPNYNFNYIAGTLTVSRGSEETSVTATNILTPNHDGKNDRWMIKDIELYPDNKVSVYDRAGRLVYTRKGYNNEWDGRLNGSALVEGTYYYVVELGPGKRRFKGFITIINRR